MMNKKRVILALSGIIFFFIMMYLISTFVYEEKFANDLLSLAGSVLFFILGTFSIKDEAKPTKNSNEINSTHYYNKAMS